MSFILFEVFSDAVYLPNAFWPAQLLYSHINKMFFVRYKLWKIKLWPWQTNLRYCTAKEIQEKYRDFLRNLYKSKYVAFIFIMESLWLPPGVSWNISTFLFFLYICFGIESLYYVMWYRCLCICYCNEHYNGSVRQYDSSVITFFYFLQMLVR